MTDCCPAHTDVWESHLQNRHLRTSAAITPGLSHVPQTQNPVLVIGKAPFPLSVGMRLRWLCALCAGTRGQPPCLSSATSVARMYWGKETAEEGVPLTPDMKCHLLWHPPRASDLTRQNRFAVRLRHSVHSIGGAERKSRKRELEFNTSPKSVIFRVPSLVIRQLPGFRSR